MKKFKQKQYTIQEGHYTGPKDIEKIPSTFDVLSKSVIGGIAAGGVIGGVIKESGISEDTGIFDGIQKGGLSGFFVGVLAKTLLNILHKPMKTVKFQEVDKLIRQEFGIYRVSGFTTGDSLKNRKTVDEKFSFNDRKVTDYKISFAICNNSVVMYTLGISSEELDRLSASLDYYCKKYYGMEYTSRVINSRTNSYSVNITFTNHSVISKFILEVSEILGYKINLLNDDSLMKIKITENEEDDEKQFSVKPPYLNKYELGDILLTSGTMFLPYLAYVPAMSIQFFILDAVIRSINKLGEHFLISKFGKGDSTKFGPEIIEHVFNTNGKYEGVHYTIDDKNNQSCNMTVFKGLFMITTNKGSKEDLLLNKVLTGDAEMKTKVISEKVTFRTLRIKDKRQLKFILDKILGVGIKPNIYLP